MAPCLVSGVSCCQPVTGGPPVTRGLVVFLTAQISAALACYSETRHFRSFMVFFRAYFRIFPKFAGALRAPSPTLPTKHRSSPKHAAGIKVPHRGGGSRGLLRPSEPARGRETRRRRVRTRTASSQPGPLDESRRRMPVEMLADNEEPALVMRGPR